MRILVVGGGGREHALAHYLGRSARRPDVFVAPGNAGTALVATNVSLPASDIDALLNFAKSKEIDLTVVGPEQPLSEGIVDAFRKAGLAIVGPTAAAARLESSKAFAKAFMEKYGIPTASSRTFKRSDHAAAVAYVHEQGAPIVVKASGLAAGKGAVVCRTVDEALAALSTMMLSSAFGDASDEVVIESFMAGEEASLFALCDGKDYALLPSAQDHKRIGEGDTGPNTGGMGAYAPAPIMTPELTEVVRESIVEPTLRGMAAEGTPYTGFLYVGLMISDDEVPRVVEYNCRLGDPETQAMLPLIATDGIELLTACVEGRIGEVAIAIRESAAAVVVMASKGYPGKHERNVKVTGLDAENDSQDPTDGMVVVYHAGTRRMPDGSIVSSGGRVLGVAGVDRTLEQALRHAYDRVNSIRFDGATYRRDIGQKGIKRLEVLSGV